jgi:hypothetical protein
MKLQHPFSEETRNLYLYRYDCDSCGSNQMLELHHITGRRSNSPLNASLLCHNCHGHAGHSLEEEQKLFARNLQNLCRDGYTITSEDMDFLTKNGRLITNNPLMAGWLNSK